MLPADVKLMFWQHSRAHHSWHPYRVYAHTARNSCELRYCKKLNSLYICVVGVLTVAVCL